MIADWREPKGLSRDAEPLADYRACSNHRVDAVRGSARLLAAILKAYRPRPALKIASVAPRTWPERKRAREQVKELQRQAASYFGLTIDDITGGRGPNALARKRQIAMYVAREAIKASYPDIGLCFRRDHSTVMHACRTVANDASAQRDVDALRSAFVA